MPMRKDKVDKISENEVERIRKVHTSFTIGSVSRGDLRSNSSSTNKNSKCQSPRHAAGRLIILLLSLADKLVRLDAHGLVALCRVSTSGWGRDGYMVV